MCVAQIDLINQRGSPYSPNEPSPGSCPAYIHTPPWGTCGMGASFVVGLTGTHIIPIWAGTSLGLSSQNCLSDSSSIQPGPTRLCSSARCLDWASITNLLSLLTVERDKRGALELELELELAGLCGALASGAECWFKWRRGWGVRQGKWSKAQWREMLQSISNLIQQWWAEKAFLFPVPRGLNSEPFFKLKEGFGLDVEAHESQCGICTMLYTVDTCWEKEKKKKARRQLKGE